MKDAEAVSRSLASAVPAEFQCKDQTPIHNGLAAVQSALEDVSMEEGPEQLLLRLQPPGLLAGLSATEHNRAAASGGYQQPRDAEDRAEDSGRQHSSAGPHVFAAHADATHILAALGDLIATEPIAVSGGSSLGPQDDATLLDAASAAASGAGGRDASAQQLALDIARDEFVINGVGLSGADSGAEEVLAAAQAAIADAVNSLMGAAAVTTVPGDGKHDDDEQDGVVVTGASILERVVQAGAEGVIRTACRTESGAVSFAVVRAAVSAVRGGMESVHIAPESAVAVPARITLSAGAFQVREIDDDEADVLELETGYLPQAPGATPESGPVTEDGRHCAHSRWEVGIRAVIEAPIVFRLVDIAAASRGDGGAISASSAASGDHPGRWNVPSSDKAAAGPSSGLLGRLVAVYRRRLGLPLPLKQGRRVQDAVESVGRSDEERCGGVWVDAGAGCQVQLLMIDEGVALSPALWSAVPAPR
jgi:hypothetical protein